MGINENTLSCMIREVREETGLDLRYTKFEIINYTIIHSDIFIYILRIFNNPLPICFPPLENGFDNYEIKKVEWVPVKNAIKRKNNSITRLSLLFLQKGLLYNKKKWTH